MPDAPDTVPLLGFGLANYRSFDSDGFVLHNLKKVNVFIGKNNAGKSNILCAINLIGQVKGDKDDFTGLDWVVDGHRQQEVPISVTAIIPAEAVFSPSPPSCLKSTG